MRNSEETSFFNNSTDRAWESGQVLGSEPARFTAILHRREVNRYAEKNFSEEEKSHMLLHLIG